MADELDVDIVTPDGQTFQGSANGVRAPGVEGSFEVRNAHAPMIAAFGIGPLIVKTDSAHEYADVHDNRIVFATSGGFLEVVENQVTVLGETVEPASEIDVERAENAEERALQRLEDGVQGEERETYEAALERARNRLRVGMGQVGTKS
ncbi:ATP synthase F1 subunit epsilon [Salinibacter sp. 10B]|uniref:ATP synthase F1 subunit epsilon n=1 Tax=Salinibacter sp. 10B TaxID=1923971 RepID=UPI000CF42FBC|nr:ATP synthase F1 subunit epsilon [Salinibacter sp. 10B]PQJ34290.1 ATP synthase F1 subunit epsilon [Salinibacter sp. 10B]